MKSITIKKLLSWSPCDDYDSEEKLLVITGGKKSLTPLEVLDLKIPAVERVWVLLRTKVLGKRAYKKIGLEIAMKAVKKHCLKCGVPEVEQWAKKYLKEPEKYAYAAAAYAAAAYAAANAAYTAYDAAGGAYAAAAYAAAADADAAAAAAAAHAGRDKERKAQLKIIKRYLKC